MLNLVSLLVAAALVSLQCGLEASALLDNSKMELDNNLQPNVVPTPKRRLRKYVHIYLPPPETVRHVAGQRLELECQVTGSPSPAVTWLRNDEPISDFEEDVNEIIAIHPSSFARMTSKLILTSPSNGDVYTCVANSGIKQATASTTVYSAEGDHTDLLTLEKLFRLPSKPTITTFYNEVFQEIGTNILLPCRAQSNSKAQVYWQDNRDNLVYGNSRIRMLQSGDLLITGLRWDDMGNFSCTAKNAFGKDSVSTFIYPTKP